MSNRQKVRICLLVMADILFIVLAYGLSCYIRFDFYEYGNYIGIIYKYLPIVVLIYLSMLAAFKMYNRIWRTAGIEEALIGVMACGCGFLLNFILMELVGERIPRTVTIVAWGLITIWILTLRISYRLVRRILIMTKPVDKSNRKNVLIIGAGACGQIIIKEIEREERDKYRIIGLVDDDKIKVNNYFKGYKILGDRFSIAHIVKEKAVDLIMIAIPSLDGENKKALLELCNSTKVKVKIIPGLHELIGGKVNLSKMRDVDLKDLLGRPQVKLDKDGISKYLGGKRVLVTGAGGSIGSELCRQIATFKPSKLIMLDIYENNIYEIQNELGWSKPDLNKVVLVASVRDRKRLENIFKEYKPQVVFHAAAHKHVPLMEDSPSEAIKNNVCGTLNVAECANKFNVERFVLISTDKAVNPTNVMGATKRLCEMIIQGMNKISDTEFVAVRFGNVLGSNGSVIPLFKRQIKAGGPVTLTHKDITRYFMLIPEAAQLVLQAGAYAKGGEIFVLDMGKPVRIYDLAENLIKLSGFEPNKDIKIKITGLRKGEKLTEELLMSEEGLTETKHEKIFIGRPGDFNIEEVKISINMLLEASIRGNREEVKNCLKQVVKTYKDPEVFNAKYKKQIEENKKSQEEVAAAVEFIGNLGKEE